MALKFRRLPDMGKATCHECGREWWQVMVGCDGPEPRPFAELRGVIGCCQIRTILCPHCLDENADTLFDAASLRAVYASDRDYDRELALDLLVGRLEWARERAESALLPPGNVTRLVASQTLGGK